MSVTIENLEELESSGLSQIGEEGTSKKLGLALAALISASARVRVELVREHAALASDLAKLRAEQKGGDS